MLVRMDESTTNPSQILRTRGWTWSGDVSVTPTELFALLLHDLEGSLRLEGAPEILRPYTQGQAPRLSLSAQTGLNRQPLHTDRAHFARPPRYVLLECLKGGANPCGTDILVPDMQKLQADRPYVLVHPGWVARRNFIHSFYCRILDISQNGMIRLRYDPSCMSNSHIEAAKELAYSVLKDRAEMRTVILNTGDWILLDNWRVLHGKSDGARFSRDRRLRRTYWGMLDELVV